MALAWTQIHHPHEWVDGGPTSVANGLSLCSFHHHRVHEGGWRLRYNAPTNTVRVWRPDGRPYELIGHPPRPAGTGPPTTAAA